MAEATAPLSSTSDEKSLSQRQREEGNRIFRSASETGITSYVQICRLRDALRHYRNAKSSSSSTLESVSAAKNIGVTAKKIANLTNEERTKKEENESAENPEDCTELFEEAVQSFEHACEHASCKGTAWWDDLLSKYHQVPLPYR